MARILRNDKRGRGKNLDRAERHVTQISDRRADQVQSTLRSVGFCPLRSLRFGAQESTAGRRLRGCVLLELLGECRLPGEADHLIDELAVLEEQNCRNRSDVELG